MVDDTKSALETMKLREELGDHLFFTFFMIATVVALLAFSIGPMSCKWPQPRVLVESFGLSWTGRSVTSDEASKWLGELLKLCSSELEKVSSHSLKAATLSWMAKA